MAKRKTRVTTSVSTLVNDVAYIQDIARVAGRKDLLASCNEIAGRVNKLVADYNNLRYEVNDLKRAFLVPVVANDESEEEEEE
jgi:hypothetical protein